MSAARARSLRTAIGLALLTAGLAGAPRPAPAADLREGIQVEPDSIDPHFHWFGGDLDLTFQVWDSLIDMHGDGKLNPSLATSWKPLGDSAWEFTLRPDVTFHDGSKLTAADVVFTLHRAPDVPRSPSGFGPLLRDVVSIDAPDPSHVVVHTKGPVPLLPTYLSRIAIIPEHVGPQLVGRDATTQDYDSGKVAIGSGPYRFVSWARGDAITLRRNDAYWGARPAWDTVRLRYIPNPTARLAALRAGDVDIIDSVSVEDVAGLKSNPAFRVREAPSSDVIGFQIDVAQRKPPFVSGPNGEALDKNPLADMRVRRALAMAINRDALRDRVMNGEMATNAQVMAPGQFGYDPDLKPIPYDPAGAKKLLAEAGYPNGFRMSTQCQADRYPNGVSLCAATAQMFVRIGVQTDPVPIPHSIFIGHANRHEYSMFTYFMLADTGEPSESLLGGFATTDAAKGWGIINRGQYSNPTFDQLLDTSTHQVDPVQREATLRKAEAIFTNDDVAWIPLLRPLNIEAMKAGIDHPARADGFIFAADVNPASP